MRRSPAGRSSRISARSAGWRRPIDFCENARRSPAGSPSVGRTYFQPIRPSSRSRRDLRMDRPQERLDAPLPSEPPHEAAQSHVDVREDELSLARHQEVEVVDALDLRSGNVHDLLVEERLAQEDLGLVLPAAGPQLRKARRQCESDSRATSAPGSRRRRAAGPLRRAGGSRPARRAGTPRAAGSRGPGGARWARRRRRRRCARAGRRNRRRLRPSDRTRFPRRRATSANSLGEDVGPIKLFLRCAFPPADRGIAASRPARDRRAGEKPERGRIARRRSDRTSTGTSIPPVRE